jgi:hypothetical protein
LASIGLHSCPVSIDQLKSATTEFDLRVRWFLKSLFVNNHDTSTPESDRNLTTALGRLAQTQYEK